MINLCFELVLASTFLPSCLHPVCTQPRQGRGTSAGRFVALAMCAMPELQMFKLFLSRCCREPGDLICWEHIQQQKHLERQRAALQERLQHVVPDAQLAVHLEMKQPVLITQLRLGEVGLSPSQPNASACMSKLWATLLDSGIAALCAVSRHSTLPSPEVQGSSCVAWRRPCAVLISPCPLC